MQATTILNSTIMLRFIHCVLITIFAVATFLIAPNVIAQQQSGCFIGKNHLGNPSKVYVNVERYGDWFEITGKIYSSGTDHVYKFKADGHSGAGRIFEAHEYDSGALFMRVKNLTESSLVLQVESYGIFDFRAVNCELTATP